MVSVDKLIRTCYLELGTTENGTNHVKYWNIMKKDYQGQAWCDCFVSYVFLKTFGVSEANRLLCGGLNSFWTPASFHKFKVAGRAHYGRDCRRGDVFYLTDRNGIISHTGIVRDVDNDGFWTYEGNYGNKVGTRHINFISWFLCGFGRPDYKIEPINLNKKPIWECKVTCSVLSIRTWAGTKYNELKSRGPLRSGEHIYVCDNIPGIDGSMWYYVRDKNGIYGFVCSDYITGV